MDLTSRLRVKQVSQCFLSRDCAASNTLCLIEDLFFDHEPAKPVGCKNGREKLSGDRETNQLPSIAFDALSFLLNPATFPISNRLSREVPA